MVGTLRKRFELKALSALPIARQRTEDWRGSPCCGVACSVTETHGSRLLILWVHY